MRRTLRALKFVALGLLGIVGIGLIWLALANGRANARLQAKVQELRDAGMPTSLGELKRTPPQPDKNAVTYLRRARADVEAIQREVDAACNTGGDTDEHSPNDDALWEGRLTPATEKGIRDAFARYPAAVPLLVQASECPAYDWQYDYDAGTQYGGREPSCFDDVLNSANVKRSPFRVLYYRSLLLAHDGKTSEALQTCLAMLRLEKLYGQDPLLVNYLVNLAVLATSIHATNHVLRAGALPREAHAELEAVLARQDLAALFRHALVTERAYGLQCFEEMRGNVRFAFTWRPAFKNDVASYVDLFGELSRANEQSLAVDLAKIKAVSASAGPFAGTIAPAIEASRVALARYGVQLRALRVLNQLKLQDPIGEKDLRIDHLGLPSDATTDPFNGKPLVVTKTPDGWLIYSVGMDLKDDGGKIDDGLTDVGLGPAPAVGKK